MSLYESNFLRLLNLIPQIKHLDGCFRSRVAGDCDLFVEVLERCRYTVTLLLTYRFECDEGPVAIPDMVVRVYLDGALAEAMAVADYKRALRQRLGCSHRSELEGRWRLNVLFNKWLEYLSDQGHLILDR